MAHAISFVASRRKKKFELDKNSIFLPPLPRYLEKLVL